MDRRHHCRRRRVGFRGCVPCSARKRCLFAALCTRLPSLRAGTELALGGIAGVMIGLSTQAAYFAITDAMKEK